MSSASRRASQTGVGSEITVDVWSAAERGRVDVRVRVGVVGRRVCDGVGENVRGAVGEGGGDGVLVAVSIGAGVGVAVGVRHATGERMEIVVKIKQRIILGDIPTNGIIIMQSKCISKLFCPATRHRSGAKSTSRLTTCANLW